MSNSNLQVNVNVNAFAVRVAISAARIRSTMWFDGVYKKATNARKRNAKAHAEHAEYVAEEARRDGDWRTAEVWERHAINCRRIARRGAACTP